MALTVAPIFCSCGRTGKSSLLGNEKPSCYDGVYFVVGQPYLAYREKTVPSVRERVNVDVSDYQDKSYLHSAVAEPQLAVVKPVASTQPSNLSEIAGRHDVTPEPQSQTANATFPTGPPPPPPPTFETPSEKKFISNFDIAGEIKNWYKTGKKLRPAASKTNGRTSDSASKITSRSTNGNNGAQNKAVASPMAPLSNNEGELFVDQGDKYIAAEKACEKNEDPMDMVKAALIKRVSAIRGDENSSEESEQDEEDSESEDNK